MSSLDEYMLQNDPCSPVWDDDISDEEKEEYYYDSIEYEPVPEENENHETDRPAATAL